jgi:hypothetical protein
MEDSESIEFVTKLFDAGGINETLHRDSKNN